MEGRWKKLLSRKGRGAMTGEEGSMGVRIECAAFWNDRSCIWRKE